MRHTYPPWFHSCRTKKKDNQRQSLLDIASPRTRAKNLDSSRLPTTSGPLGPCVETPERLAYASCLPLHLVEGWKIRDWSNPDCRFVVEVDQGEFLYSRIFSIHSASETLSRRILHPPMINF